ncbi:bifunctional DNA-formamidopyrimidine glycosylase/DNA-(apurinic or apyrimidinic site) lyase [Conexibacter sp. W3-3-2]|uniref:bifunctional DNA-formamidopyrimidine glycosylase/DNA-(apurinic or apyrimidinic site) lyase n=1 Tax=Conexibacter sp. W3-3-2 TaxID=2675227 RepID=UPI0012BA0266|nr:bifunctional DNA-formamidopyrimidine glycosylase/DNA-(apurinic or apyrimidinic site) lyase [Conexibacter sp. W3-3-2]MTD43025.1 bifunctional DNA-formamidopyrimidine glycosylase/DNA-(apurinic or apyrimidinic site) lyase [Conexibacter sp. W3-3-2]
MPELPEVETIRRGLVPFVEGRTLTRLEILDPRWCLPRAPEEVVDALVGRRIERLGRRGKYLIWTFTDEIHLLVHLRMTGTFLVDADEDERYQRVRLHLDDGRLLRYCDPRRFGTGELALGDAGLAAFLAPRLGVEPLDGELDGTRLRAEARGRRAPVKPFLLDQRRVAGVGNIYADEALHRAGVHPLRPVDRITPKQWDAIADGIVAALTAGLEAGGATIDDFRNVEGVYGGFQHEFLVHLRKGEPCDTCGTTIRKLVVGGRGTYVCERCQPRPRARRA